MLRQLGWFMWRAGGRRIRGLFRTITLRRSTTRNGRRCGRQALEAGQSLIFVAEDQWGIFGFISGGAIREPIVGYDAELYAIYLMPARQRRGLGQELVMTLREWLIMQGFSSMVVWVLEENLRAVSFYQRIGGLQIAQKTIEIGGKTLSEIAFGWPVL